MLCLIMSELNFELLRMHTYKLAEILFKTKNLRREKGKNLFWNNIQKVDCETILNVRFFYLLTK